MCDGGAARQAALHACRRFFGYVARLVPVRNEASTLAELVAAGRASAPTGELAHWLHERSDTPLAR